MGISLKVEVIGLRELEQVLRQLPAELVSKGQVGRALMKAAEPVLKTAKELVPKDTRRLERAIKKQKHLNPRWLNEIVGVGVDPGTKRGDKTGAYYGYIVEYRTSFLRRALEINRRESVRIFSLFMGGVVERAGRKAGNKNAQAVGAKLKGANKPALLGPGF
jgi:hypothetical protein